MKNLDGLYMDIAHRVSTESKCPRKQAGCGTSVGYGNNDCWQDDSAFLYTIKTKVVQ